MYSSSYKHRPASVAAFEDAYAKQAFLNRAASSDNKLGCTPYSAKPNKSDEAYRKEDNTNKGDEHPVQYNEKTPFVPGKPKGFSGLLSGIDGGDILLILLIFFFLSDKDSENDVLIPVLLALVLLF